MPELREEVIASEVRDRDSGMKAKAKRNAKESDISPGDIVLVKQERQNKFSHHLHLNPIKLLPKLATVL